MSKFKVSVNDSEAFEIDDKEAIMLDCIESSNQSFHVLHNNKSYQIAIKSSDLNKKSYTLIVNNREYEVNIKDSLDQLIQSMGFQVGSSKHINQIKAPMPGLILDIPINSGDEIKEGELLLILEAMKMENSIVSPINGKIKKVSVEKGATVTKNQLLIEFE